MPLKEELDLDNIKIEDICYTFNVEISTEESSDTISSIACQFCSAVLPSRNYMRDHVFKEHTSNFLCRRNNCNMRFRSQELLDVHVVQHSDQVVKTKARKKIQQPKPKALKINKTNKKNKLSKKTFNYHKIIHHSSYTCNECNTILMTRSGIFYHIKQHIAHLKCEKCSKKFMCNKEYKLHKTKCNAEILECKECNEKFQSQNKYDMHLRKVHDSYNYNYICSICGKYLRTNSLLIDHERTHKGETPFTCDICKKSFSSKVKIFKHINGMHLANYSHQCEICGTMCKTKHYLKIHERGHNPEAKKFSCKFCNAKFLFNVLLKKHLKIHIGTEKTFKCQICSKEFTSNSGFWEHKKLVHSEIKVEKKHKCPHCIKSFYQKFKLQRHIYTHTGEQPHGCEVCGRKFKQMSQLLTHKIRVHKIMPYECEKCDEKFRIKSDLLSHLTVH